MTYRLVFLIGPSGAGKDSVLHGLRADWQLPEPACFAQRTITRPVKPNDEQHEAVDMARFEEMLHAQIFAMHWQANGLSYGVRMSELMPLNTGHWVFVNGSRAYLPDLLIAWPQATVVHIGAAREVLAQRLAQRGRETEDAVLTRLSRKVALDLPVQAISINNSGAISSAVSALSRALKMRVQPAILRP